MIFYDLYCRSQKESLPGSLKRGPQQKRTKQVQKLQRPFSRGGPKRGNPIMTTSTVTARRKGDPQHYVEGKKDASE